MAYKWGPWGNSGLRRDNCYAYSFGDHSSDNRMNKSVPGNHAGLPPLNSNYKTCKGLCGRVIADNPRRVYRARPTERCKKSYYKVMMFVAPKNDYGNSNGDFHFYKQHGVVDYKVKRGDTYKSIAGFFKIPIIRVQRAKTRTEGNKFVKEPKLQVGKTIRFKANVFSHKMGWATGPLLEDAKGKAIFDPRKANRNYAYKYTKYCSSFCVKNKGVDVDPKIRKNGW